MIKNKNGIGSRFSREPGIGYAKTYGNSKAGNRRGEVPGAKRKGCSGVHRITSVKRVTKYVLLKKKAGKL